MRKRLSAFLLVPRRGLEPPSLAAYAPQAYAYTNSATWAGVRHAQFRFAHYSETVRYLQTKPQPSLPLQELL